MNISLPFLNQLVLANGQAIKAFGNLPEALKFHAKLRKN
jgi:hypothetical protein